MEWFNLLRQRYSKPHSSSGTSPLTIRKENFSKKAIVIACALSVCASSFCALAQTGRNQRLASIDSKSAQIIIDQIEPEIQDFVDKQQRIPGQGKQVLVKVTPDPATGIVWIDLESNYLPKNSSGFTEDFGEMVRQIENKGYDLLENIVELRYIEVRIGGKTLNQIFPPERVSKDQKLSTISNAAAVQGLVVLNPGHGKYLNHEDETWRYQRPVPYVGTTDVYEDTVTPSYSAQLHAYLILRSSTYVTSVEHTRDLGTSANTIDPNSGLPWYQLAARYYLKRLYPTLGSTIWNKFPNGSPSRSEPSRSNLREYDDDIRSRPEYANYINAETMISLHTDAGESTARGATVVANIDDAESYQLAENIHCYLTEQITQLPEYADYVIRPTVRSGSSYGESVKQICQRL